jgi:hypothetical protein
LEKKPWDLMLVILRDCMPLRYEILAKNYRFLAFRTMERKGVENMEPLQMCKKPRGAKTHICWGRKRVLCKTFDAYGDLGSLILGQKGFNNFVVNSYDFTTKEVEIDIQLSLFLHMIMGNYKSLNYKSRPMLVSEF